MPEEERSIEDWGSDPQYYPPPFDRSEPVEVDMTKMVYVGDGLYRLADEGNHME